MIVDILDRHDPRQVGLSGLFSRFVELLTKRSAIDETDVQVAKAHDVVVGVEFAHQRLVDEDELAFPFDDAAAADAPYLWYLGFLAPLLGRRRTAARPEQP